MKLSQIFAMVLYLNLSVAISADDSLTEIACLPGEQKKIVVTESDFASAEFVVRGAAGIAETPSQSCWCGMRDSVLKSASKLNFMLGSIPLANAGDVAGAKSFIRAHKIDATAVKNEILKVLELTRDFEFEVNLPAGVGLRSESASCLSDLELENFVQQVGVFIDESTSK